MNTQGKIENNFYRPRLLGNVVSFRHSYDVYQKEILRGRVLRNSITSVQLKDVSFKRVAVDFIRVIIPYVKWNIDIY